MHVQRDFILDFPSEMTTVKPDAGNAGVIALFVLLCCLAVGLT